MLEETTAYDFCINNANTENGGLGATALIMPDEKFTFENFKYITNDGEVVENLGNHMCTAYEIIKEQYDLPIVARDLDDICKHLDEFAIALHKLDNCFLSKKISDRVKQDIIKNYIKDEVEYDFGDSDNKLNGFVNGGIRNIIMITYVIYNGFQFVSIELPSYITSYQVEQLENLSEEIKDIEENLRRKYSDDQYKFIAGVKINNFNPITHEQDNSFESIRFNNDFYGEEDFENGKVNDPIKSALEYMKVNGRVNDNIKNSFTKNVKVGSRTI